MKLFGSSGIRGLVNVEVTPLLTQKVGAALASQFEGGAIIVGRDTRLSGKMLEAALTSGIASCGIVTGSLGIVPTPAVALLTREMGAEAGVAITASHNPPEYNGLKIFDTTGMAYTGKQQAELEETIEKEEFMTSSWSRVGRVEEIDGGRFYIDTLANAIGFMGERNIVCDLFNGATCTVAPEVFDELGCNATMLNAQPDGSFPAGNPEPNPESLTRLGRMVRETKASIGFGFDGDGDRMMAVDEKGSVPSPDRVLAAYARHVVAERGGGIIVTHVGASMSIEEAVESVGGSVIRTKVGDVHITEAMIANDAIFGGEPVGAWVHPEVHLCPDGILSALELMKALEEEGKTLSEMVADVPDYPTLRDKVPCPNKAKGRVMDGVSSSNSRGFTDVRNVTAVDGVRIELEDGWALIRPSGTEPVIRVTVEAREEKRAKELMESSRSLVESLLGGIV